MRLARQMRNAPHIPGRPLASVAGLALLVLVGCTMVGDKLTGVGFNRGGPTTCIKQCNDQFKILFDEEQKLHDTNVGNCQTLPQSEKNACLTAESARHSAVMEELGQAKIECRNDCHDQGAGSAG